MPETSVYEECDSLISDNHIRSAYDVGTVGFKLDTPRTKAILHVLLKLRDDRHYRPSLRSHADRPAAKPRGDGTASPIHLVSIDLVVFSVPFSKR